MNSLEPSIPPKGVTHNHHNPLFQLYEKETWGVILHGFLRKTYDQN